MAKQKSRATRLSEALSIIEGIKGELEDLASELSSPAEERAKVEEYVNRFDDIISKFEYGDIESLAEEMGSWRDNLSGTNLENSDRYTRIEEAANILEDAISELESIAGTSASIDEKSEDQYADLTTEVEEVVSQLNNIIGNLEGVEFPGMFG